MREAAFADSSRIPGFPGSPATVDSVCAPMLASQVTMGDEGVGEADVKRSLEWYK